MCYGSMAKRYFLSIIPKICLEQKTHKTSPKNTILEPNLVLKVRRWSNDLVLKARIRGIFREIRRQSEPRNKQLSFGERSSVKASLSTSGGSTSMQTCGRSSFLQAGRLAPQ